MTISLPTFSLFNILVNPQESELQRLTSAREAEIKYIREQNTLEINKNKQLSDIETEKFRNMVSAIGADTIKSMALAGPEMQVSSWSYGASYSGPCPGAVF